MTKPMLTVDLNDEGEIIAVKLRGKKVKMLDKPSHRCRAVYTVDYRLQWCKPKESKPTHPSTPTAASDPCCIRINGRLVCWC